MIWVTLVIANNRNKTLNFREINFIAAECWRRTARRCSTFTLDQSYKEELKLQTETEEGGLLYLTRQLLKNLFYHEKYNGIMQNVATAYAGSPPKKKKRESRNNENNSPRFWRNSLQSHQIHEFYVELLLQTCNLYP